jgi:hypothetical protein
VKSVKREQKTVAVRRREEKQLVAIEKRKAEAQWCSIANESIFLLMSTTLGFYTQLPNLVLPAPT